MSPLKEGEKALEKKCSQCGERKPVEGFYRNHRAKDGLQSYCKTCQRVFALRRAPQRRQYAWEYTLRNKFDLTKEDYQEMLDAQQGVCRICRTPPASKKLAVDHCHATGKIRGLLCLQCNVAIGHLRDDPELLRRALAYLEG